MTTTTTTTMLGQATTRLNSSKLFFVFVTLGSFVTGFFLNILLLRQDWLCEDVLRAYDEKRDSCPPATTTTPFCLRNYHYLIVSVQRSGTHYLTQTLKLHPYLSFYSEIFKGGNEEEFHREYKVKGYKFKKFTRKELVPLLTELFYGFGGAYQRNNTQFPRLERRDGFIVHNNQLNYTPELLPLLGESRAWKAIHLVRRNLFHVHVSRKMHELSGSAACLVNSTCESRSRTIRLDPETILRELEHIKQMQIQNRELLQTHKVPFIEVTYEGLLDGTESFCDIWTFCECSCVEMRPISMMKLVDRNYSSIVENYHELKTIAKDTEFLSFFDED